MLDTSKIKTVKDWHRAMTQLAKHGAGLLSSESDSAAMKETAERGKQKPAKNDNPNKDNYDDAQEDTAPDDEYGTDDEDED